MKKYTFILSCEHAVNTIPSAYQSLFHQQEAILNTHRGVDLGVLDIARDLSQTIHCPLLETTVSRLIIDCNRSLTHGQCFSEFTKGLPQTEKQHIIDQYYQPFRQKAEALVHNKIQEGFQVIHLSMHSFTPILNHHVRNADIGFLYDPRRLSERKQATQWRKRILEENPGYRIRMNYPYQGISDCFVRTLRKKYPEQDYLGFEIEINQAIIFDKRQMLGEVLALLYCTLVPV